MDKKFLLLFVFLVGLVFLTACSQEGVGARVGDQFRREASLDSSEIFVDGTDFGNPCSCSGEGLCMPVSEEHDAEWTDEEHGIGYLLPTLEINCESTTMSPCSGSCGGGGVFIA